MEDVVLPARLMRMLGAKVLFLTNASGGVNAGFKAGDFMLITDHIPELFVIYLAHIRKSCSKLVDIFAYKRVRYKA